MKRIILFISLILISLSAFSQIAFGKTVKTYGSQNYYYLTEEFTHDTVNLVISVDITGGYLFKTNLKTKITDTYFIEDVMYSKKGFIVTEYLKCEDGILFRFDTKDDEIINLEEFEVIGETTTYKIKYSTVKQNINVSPSSTGRE